MAQPLMPKATAVWLVDNTTLTFEQIAEFCGLHELEVKGVADGEVAVGIVGLDPVANGQLTQEELDRCSADPSARLKIIASPVPLHRRPPKGARYTPLSKRQDRPDAINWLLRNHPELSDAQIQKLLGTTKATVNAVRDRTHWNMPNIKPQDPVSLGICSQTELAEAVEKAQVREERKAKREAREAAKRAAAKAEAEAGDDAAAEPAPEAAPVAEAEPEPVAADEEQA